VNVLPPPASNSYIQTRARLSSAVSTGGYFTLAFGTVIGSAWVVVMGEWLRTAGPGGTAVGFLAGAVVMVLIALCYGELAAASPIAGAEFLYTYQTFGRRAGFLVGWFLAPYAISVCAFEAIACAWLLRALVPGINLGPAYYIAGEEVGWDALLVGSTGAIIIGLLHYLGARTAIFFQNIVTYGFIGVTALLIICGLVRGDPENLSPLFASTTSQSWVSGAFWIFATCAFFLNGWQAALHAIEERRSSVTPTGAVIAITIAIAASALFYIGIVAAAANASPWRALVQQELPAAAAFRSLGFHGALGTLTLFAATISLTKTWSAMTWVASRVIYAQAQQGFLPAVFGRVDPRTGAPRAAIVAVVLVTLAGIMLGHGAILPIVDIDSLWSAISMILCLVVLLRRRSHTVDRSTYTVPGGLATIVAALFGALIMVSVAVLHPLLAGTGKVPPEWTLITAWAALGVIVLTFSPYLRHRSSG
jgi:basic amino acid/polyamine antiporter, APA family